MKNKRYLIVALCMVTSLFMTACGGEDEQVEYTEETSVVTTEVTPITHPPVTDATQKAEEIEEEGTSNFKKAVETVISSVEWAKLDEVTDEQILTEFFKLDKNNANYKDIIVMQCPMSAVTAELILIEAQDGKVEDVKADLEARREKLINVDAFYPDSQAIAEDSIIGVHNNVVYFIAAEKAAESEEILKTELGNLGY